MRRPFIRLRVLELRARKLNCSRLSSREHILLQMEKCSKSNLILEVKTNRKPRFKAGSELSSKVHKMAVELNEEINETSESIELKLHLTTEACAEETGCSDE